MEPPELQTVTLTDLPASLFPDGQCRLIIIGKTGNGKSSTGNSILGYKAFEPQVGINSGTKEGDLQSVTRGDLEIQVMDTPGLQDTEVSNEVIAERITRSLLAMHPGPHAVILCLSCVNRFTPEEVKVFQALKEIFGDKMPSYLIVVFSRRDEFESHGASFEEQLKRCTELKYVLAQANNRYVLFDNRSDLSDNKKKEQVDQLLDKIKEVVVQNEGNFFRHKLSDDLNSSMAALRRAEMEGWEADPQEAELYSQVTKQPPKTNPDENSSETAAGRRKKDSSETIIAMKEKKLVSERLKQFETRHEPRAPELSGEEIASKFKLKTPTDVSSNRRRPPVPGRPAPSPPTGGHQDGKDSEAKPTQELIKRFQDISKSTAADDAPPQKPQRTHLHGSKEARNAPELIHQFETKPAQDEHISAPASFVYEVPDRPGMSLSQKQRMVDEDLKRKLARGAGLNQEQTKELEKVSKSLGKKIREGMKKFAVKTLDACRIM